MTNPLLDRIKKQQAEIPAVEPPTITLKTQSAHPVKRRKVFDPSRQPEPEPAYGSDPGLEVNYE